MLNFPLSDLLREEDLSVIIPVFNESENLPELVDRIHRSLGHVNFELVLVDDNSPDGTAIVAEELNMEYGNLKVLKRPTKLGLSSAVIEGFNKSTRETRIFAVLDADMQHPPELLVKMHEKIIEGADVVIASRYTSGGGTNGWRLSRKIISRFATTLAHLLLPKTRGVKDVLSGFFMIKAKVISGTKLDPIGYKILLELLVKGNYSKVCEIPYLFEKRKNGKSNLSLKEIMKFAIHLYRLFLNRKVPCKALVN
jgi:dolichol-phosphate mannosyltransferase